MWPKQTRHAWLTIFKRFRDLETDHELQRTVHIWAQRFWLANVAPVVIMFVYFPHLWINWGLLLTTIYSLYANWATDNGAASSAEAATPEKIRDILSIRNKD